MVSLKNRKLEAFWKSSRRLIFLAFTEIVILYLIGQLASWGILDVKTAISVVMTEVGIGVFLYYILGERRRSHEEEIVNLMDAVEKFAHLEAYSFSVFPHPFEYTFYFIENTTTKQCYKAPKYLEEMIDRGVIKTRKCKSEKEMKSVIVANKSKLNDREPSFIELKANGKEKNPKANSLYLHFELK